jgi:hypothetical protein
MSRPEKMMIIVALMKAKKISIPMFTDKGGSHPKTKPSRNALTVAKMPLHGNVRTIRKIRENWSFAGLLRENKSAAAHNAR